MKKWLIIQSNLVYGPYGNTPCEFLRECFSLQYAIQQNGDKADVWGLRHSNYEQKPDFSEYDYIFMEEQYEFNWIPWEEIANSKALKLQLCADIHVHKTYNRWSGLFDILMYPYKEAVLQGQKSYPDKEVIWFPSAMDGRYYNFKSLPILYNVAWFGDITRKYIIELQKDIGLVQMMKSGWDYINSLASTRVVVNSRMNKDINYKNFETIGVGTCVVCDYDETYEELGFIDGVNCYMFKDYDECLYKIKLALQNDNWIEVGINGLVLSREHTYEKRIARLKKVLNGEINKLSFK